MSFRVSYGSNYESEKYEVSSDATSDFYEFVSEDHKRLEIKPISDRTIEFRRQTDEVEIQGTLTLDTMTKIVCRVAELDGSVEYDVFLRRLVVDFPREISFCYQIIVDGRQVEDPIDVLIAEEV